MTCLEGLAVLVWIAVAPLVAFIGQRLFGIHWGVGFVVAFALPIVFARILESANTRLLLYPAARFPCICAEGSGGRIIDPHAEETFVERCSCGRVYSQHRGSVYLIRPGTRAPYMKWVRFRGWRPWAATLEVPYR